MINFIVLLVINESLTRLHFLISNGWILWCRAFSRTSFSSSESPSPVAQDKFLRHFSNIRSFSADDNEEGEEAGMRYFFDSDVYRRFWTLGLHYYKRTGTRQTKILPLLNVARSMVPMSIGTRCCFWHRVKRICYEQINIVIWPHS